MRKLLAVVKREYIQRVRSKIFIVFTVLLPTAISLFGIVPALVLSIRTPPLRVAVIDQTGKMYVQLRQSLNLDSSDDARSDNVNQLRGFSRRCLGSFVLEEVTLSNQSP